MTTQSPCYKYARNVNCPVTIIDIYSEPIIKIHDDIMGKPVKNKHSKFVIHILSIIKISTVMYYDHKMSLGFDVPTSCICTDIRQDITEKKL